MKDLCQLEVLVHAMQWRATVAMATGAAGSQHIKSGHYPCIWLGPRRSRSDVRQ